MKKNLTIGILAHVDAGKTTLSEAMLYLCGSIRKIGRVDHGDTFLDTYSLEKERGITIFSKQAVLETPDTTIYLLDTPGHVDFSVEMERTLKVLDYAILVVDGSSEIKSHTFTLWQLINKYQIPTFIFVNKMDMSERTREEIIGDFQNRLSPSCYDFTGDETDEFYEMVSLANEHVMEEYLENGQINRDNIVRAIKDREIYPCFFGSALKSQGVKEFIDGVNKYTADKSKDRSTTFGGRVYKINYDEQGVKLTNIKITGGKIAIRDLINYTDANGENEYSEKINQIRIYSGSKYELVTEASEGMVVAIAGLTSTFPGQGLGEEVNDCDMVTEPVLKYRIILEPDVDPLKAYNTIKILAEEDPTLAISWNEIYKEIEIKLMGKIQIEILTTLIQERFGLKVSFDTGNIVYKETIEEEAYGIGHYEPLRHYAEVHLALKPGKRGSGVVAFSDISTDKLEKNWQRLILTHIKEKRHKGVLTGSELTDVEIRVAAGRAHKKHTEGGDFRQATYRAVRNALMKAKSVLLEPYYDFELVVPSEMTGKAMMDIDRMCGKCDAPRIDGEITVITGSAPVATMLEYAVDVLAYTRGKGRLATTVSGYRPCHNSEEVINKMGYNPLADVRNTPDSVFCAHGAGFVVPYNEVEAYAHIKEDYDLELEAMRVISEASSGANDAKGGLGASEDGENTDGGEGNAVVYTGMGMEEDLREIFERTYGTIKSPINNNGRYVNYDDTDKEKSTTKGEAIKTYDKKTDYALKKKQPEFLLVDGYNVIFAWDSLKKLAAVNIDAARDKLIDIVSNYQGVTDAKVMVVFDAYKVKGNLGSVLKYHNVTIVYTKEAETADAYIERFAHENAKKYKVNVVTSDGLEQIIIRGEGCGLISSREFENVIRLAIDEAMNYV